MLSRGNSLNQGGQPPRPADDENNVVVSSLPPQFAQRQPSNASIPPNAATLTPSASLRPFTPGIMPSQLPATSLQPTAPSSSRPLSNPSQSNMQQMPDSNARGWSWMLMLLLVISVVAVTIAFTIALSNQNSGVANHMTVPTGRRTRDWSSTNSYSMNTFEEDQHSRLYVCMKAADITVPDDPSIAHDRRIGEISRGSPETLRLRAGE